MAISAHRLPNPDLAITGVEFFLWLAATWLITSMLTNEDKQFIKAIPTAAILTTLYHMPR